MTIGKIKSMDASPTIKQKKGVVMKSVNSTQLWQMSNYNRFNSD